MKDFKKPLIGSVVAFFVGTSCCWMSSLAIWFGGMAFFGVLLQFTITKRIKILGEIAQFRNIPLSKLNKKRCNNKYSFLADSFVLIFLFENSHYINITPVFKEKTKKKIIYPRINIYYYSVPKE